MAYVTEQLVNNPSRSHQDMVGLRSLFITVAREIYSTYRKNHGTNPRRPVGAVINHVSQRGQLIFKGKPILLPREYFVPFEEIEVLEPEVEVQTNW